MTNHAEVTLGRFAGTITRIGPSFGFLAIDDSNIGNVFFHEDVCDEQVPFATLRVGDRLRFDVKRSRAHPDKLVAGRIARETKI